MSRSVFRIAAVLLAAAALYLFWQYQNESIQTEEFVISSERLPESFDGLRITMVADVHGKSFGDGNIRLLDAVRETGPDIISINGDLVDENSDLSMVEPLISGLVRIAPTFYVTGNHEWAAGVAQQIKRQLEELGVTVLDNDYRVMQRDGSCIVAAGVDDPNGPYDMKTPSELVGEIREECAGDPYILMLAHRNDSLDEWAELSVDCVLAGHGHGGVVRLPFVGGLVGVDRSLFPEYSAGIYPEGRTQMFVGRGLGNSAVNFRLFNRPQVAVVILAADN